MAGGTSGKSSALMVTAIARCTDAIRVIHAITQDGGTTTAGGEGRHAVSDPAIVAAITALQAIQ